LNIVILIYFLEEKERKLMSRVAKISSLTQTEREQIAKDLAIKKEIPNKKFFKKEEELLYPYNVENKKIYLPFSYNTKLERPSFVKKDFEFVGKLRPEQTELRNVAVKTLNEHGAVIISAHTGYGKCLGKNTLCMMYSGESKLVQNLKVGDLLMGDDCSERKIISLARGREEMYKITSSIGDTFTCNKSHILSLIKIDGDYSCLVDIELREFLELPLKEKQKHFLYSRAVDFEEKIPMIEPETAPSIYRFHIPDEYKYNSKEIRKIILKGYEYEFSLDYPYIYLELPETKYGRLIKDLKWIARSLGGDLCKQSEGVYYFIASQKKAFSFCIESQGENDYYGFELEGKNRRFFLGNFIITHNTITAINIATKIKYPVAVLTHRKLLMTQWEEAIKTFSPKSRLQVLDDTKDDTDKNANFIIINPLNVPKRKRESYSHIGFVIIDECHLILADCLSRALIYFTPKYLLGLSATPYRIDGLNKLFNLYFGEQKIEKKLQQVHIVYPITTGFTPAFETRNGVIDWNSLLNSVARDENRNNFIISLIKTYKDRVFLVLVKRVEQEKLLFNMLKNLQESATIVQKKGDKQIYDENARVLIATTNRCGTGFNHPRLDALILASDIKEYFIQYLGRVFRRQDVQPIIFDLIDNNPILKAHFRLREKIYKEHGGIIKLFDKDKIK